MTPMSAERRAKIRDWANIGREPAIVQTWVQELLADLKRVEQERDSAYEALEAHDARIAELEVEVARLYAATRQGTRTSNVAGGAN